MASTRQATGNSKPRVVEKVETTAANPRKTTATKKRAAPKKTTATKKTTTTKKATTAAKPKANTSVPRAKKESTAKVTKKPAAKKTAAAKPVAKAKTAVKKATTPATKKEAPEQRGILEAAGAMAEGLALKAQGILTGSTGKKAAGTAKVRGTDKKPAAKK